MKLAGAVSKLKYDLLGIRFEDLPIGSLFLFNSRFFINTGSNGAVNPLSGSTCRFWDSDVCCVGHLQNFDMVENVAQIRIKELNCGMMHVFFSALPIDSIFSVSN